MTRDPFTLYRDFLKGRAGRCAFTGNEGCHAFATEDEIETTFGSRHDGQHFVWIGAGPELVGYISDSHIDALLSSGQIASTFWEMSGITPYSHAGHKAAFLLGATRMQKVLALPSEAGQVEAKAIDALPLSLRWQFAGVCLVGYAPHAYLVEKMIPLGTMVEDGEARGRLVVLARASIGAGFSDIERDAEHWADWAIQSAERRVRLDEDADGMLAQLIKARRTLQ